MVVGTLQGYLAHKKPPALGSYKACALGPMVVLGGGRFLMREVPPYTFRTSGRRATPSRGFLASDATCENRTVELQGNLAHKQPPAP